jgi:hypothetical protein
MWMRKSDEQMAQMARERSRYWLSLQGPAIMFVVGFGASCGAAIVGGRAPAPQVHWPSTWHEVFPCTIYVATLIGTIAAIAGYILQLVLKRRINPFASKVKVVICNACYRVKRLDSESKCECGGTFERFENWTWVDDRKES